ncbi:MAG: glycosyltransferase family 39 protein [Bryobacteraceae bacterium]
MLGSDRVWFWALAVLAAVVLLAPIRCGDLAGYDDARYALVAKHVVVSGHWLDIESNGGPAIEHPPLFSWMQAALFVPFGLSDPLAKLPSALCGLGVILLVAWLGRRMTGDPFTGVLAMFVMATSIYFVKYAARAMTDVPFTFFFLAAVCSWVLSDDDPRWLLAAGAFAASSAYMNQEVYGALTPSWRRYTGAFEYLWMILKSYWPWLPAMLAGSVFVLRRRDPKLRLLIVWIAVVYALCAITKSRVLRYMLPAYPAFAILSALGLLWLVPQRYLRNGLRVLTPLLAVLGIVIAIRPPVNMHAAETRPIALASTLATAPNERITFYDDGAPRFDELNQMLWYGDRYFAPILEPGKLPDALKSPETRVFIVDAKAFHADVEGRVPNQIVARAGHLICFRLTTEP